MPGIPYRQGNNVNGSLVPRAAIMHRTLGAWPGDYQIGLNGRTPGDGIGFHFLVGKASTQWVQLYDTHQKTGHARGANSWAVGIEISGQLDDQLTEWQVHATAAIVKFLNEKLGFPLSYYYGARVPTDAGFIAHASVIGSDHTDYITRDDWNRILSVISPHAPIQQKEDDDMPIYIAHPSGAISRVCDRGYHDYADVADYNLDKFMDAAFGRNVTVIPVSDDDWQRLRRIRST